MPDPMEVHVLVFLHPGDPKGDFHFETTDLPMGPNNFLYFRNWGFPGFYIHFDLQEPTLGYLFPESKLFPPNPPNQHLRAALFASSQPGCPTSPSNWGQFDGEKVINNGKTLVVWNKNQTRRDFGYALQVTKDGGATYLPLDPGGQNKNGPSRAIDWAVVAAAAAAGAAFTIVTLYGFGLLNLG
jgi:hypothetical protein